MATDLLQRVTPARSRFLRSRAWLGAVGTALLLIVMTATVPVSRVAILRVTGHLLVVDPPLPKSTDIIVVAIDADGAGALEAADLVHRGLANRVAVFADPPARSIASFSAGGSLTKMPRRFPSGSFNRWEFRIPSRFHALLPGAHRRVIFCQNGAFGTGIGRPSWSRPGIIREG